MEGIMIESIWSKTYQSHKVPGLEAVSVTTGVHGDTPLTRRLVADLEIRVAINHCTTRVDVAMTPAQMRALAGLLTAAAQRVEDELLPLLYREPEVIPFTLDPAVKAA